MGMHPNGYAGYGVIVDRPDEELLKSSDLEFTELGVDMRLYPAYSFAYGDEWVLAVGDTVLSAYEGGPVALKWLGDLDGDADEAIMTTCYRLGLEPKGSPCWLLWAEYA
jgi:hypothetical protein